ncbi:hypothetical protein [Streptomyces eurythermus]
MLLAGNDAAVDWPSDWLRDQLTAEDVVLARASRGARLGEAAAALA